MVEVVDDEQHQPLQEVLELFDNDTHDEFDEQQLITQQDEEVEQEVQDELELLQTEVIDEADQQIQYQEVL